MSSASTTDDPDVGGGSSSLKDYLTDEDEGYIGSDGGIQWLELFGAIFSGAVTAVATGYIRITQSIAAVADQGLQPIEDAADSGGTDVANAIVNAADVWGVMDVGSVSLIVNAAGVLVVLFALAWVISNV